MGIIISKEHNYYRASNLLTGSGRVKGSKTLLLLLGNEVRVLSRNSLKRVLKLPLSGVIADLYSSSKLSVLRGYPRPLYYLDNKGRLSYRLSTFPGDLEEYTNYLKELSKLARVKVIPSIIPKEGRDLRKFIKYVGGEGFTAIELEVLPLNENILVELKSLMSDLDVDLIVKINMDLLFEKGIYLLNFLHHSGLNYVVLSNTILSEGNFKQFKLVKIFLSHNDHLLFYSKIAHSIGLKVLPCISLSKVQYLMDFSDYVTGYEVQHPLLLQGIKGVKSLIEELIATNYLTTFKSVIEGMNTVLVDHGKCSKCWLCVDLCPFEALVRKGGEVEVLDERCSGCGLCIELCPRKAIKGAFLLRVIDDDTDLPER